ncbi:MAG TPA: SGNH/GDSL hydrolase family protein [Terriglobales bacterium]|nr:SGNH/GDSL hydrolase family protein [Terriglobales bacterium]
MGSSFAAGPGVATAADNPRNRCGRSSENYARQLARLRHLRLTDVSCGGATTAHLLGSWNELPSQLDALRTDTKLVTITIGGNDVNYIGGLMAGSCSSSEYASPASAAVCQGMRRRAGAADGARPPPSEETWERLGANLRQIAQEVTRRAPQARLVFVDYVTVLPDRGACRAAPLAPEAAAFARNTARRLAELTANAARSVNADVIRASRLSKDHHACSADPWATGFVSKEGMFEPAPYHPNLAGMTAIAKKIDRQLSR